MSHGANTPEARRAQRSYHQQVTGKTARRFEQPWTQAEDTELLTGPGTVADRAKRLQRTYYATCYRLQYLRRQGAQHRAELAA